MANDVHENRLQRNLHDVLSKVTDIAATREDLWWISDEYLTAGCHMIAEQFIGDEEVNYTDVHVFAERVEYVMRQHCPIMYSYYFTHSGLKHVPGGTIDILLNLIRAKRPLFLPEVHR